MNRRELLVVTAASAVVPAAYADGSPERLPHLVKRRIRAVDLGDVVLGEGAPKTIVSLISPTPNQMIESARKLSANRNVDIVELRLDKLETIPEGARAAEVARSVADAMGGKPLLVTFRSQLEGGDKPIDPTTYAELYGPVVESGAAQLLDIEQTKLETLAVRAVFERAKAKGLPVILSHHNFQATPSIDEMVERLRRQQAEGAAVCKIAVMPKDAGDVLKLLQATFEMESRHAEVPLITMAMGGIGTPSRIAGQIFGSAASFGSSGSASAPGQTEVGSLRAAMRMIAESLEG